MMKRRFVLAFEFVLLMALLVWVLPGEASVTLLMDDFDASSVDSGVWHIPTWVSPSDGTYLGRTQFRVTQNSPLPAVSSGNVNINVQTYNPTGFSFYGTDLITNSSFVADQGLDVKVRAKMDSPISPGTVGGIFLYALKPGSNTLHDEIDFELLGNRPNQVQTNIYANEPLGAGHPLYASYPSGTSADYHIYEIYWLPNQITWYIDSVPIRSETSFSLTGPMYFHLNMWVPDSQWADAYSASIQPTNYSSNQIFSMSVDWVNVSINGRETTLTSDNAPTGWQTTDVQVALNCRDFGGGCKEIHYQIDEDPETIVPGAAAIITIDRNGDHSLKYYSVDNAGNLETIKTTNVKIDKTAPSIVASATTADGAPYTAGSWTNQVVTMHFDCADLNSGVASCPADKTVAGTTSMTTGIATDIAGNSTSAGFGPVKIDKTPPTIMASASRADGAPYLAGSWANQTLTVRYTCEDNSSGVSSCAPEESFTMDGIWSASGITSDLAGNYASTGLTLKIDKRPPRVTYLGPTGTIGPGSPMISGSAADDPPSSGISAANMSLNGAPPETCILDVTSSISCPTDTLTPGAYRARISVSDNAGNVSSAQGDFLVCASSIPVVVLLSPPAKDIYWASYLDYMERLLSVGMEILNSSSELAQNVSITGVYSTHGVILATQLPVEIGPLPSLASSSMILKYVVPPGIARFHTMAVANVQDSCGVVYNLNLNNA